MVKDKIWPVGNTWEKMEDLNWKQDSASPHFPTVLPE